MRNGNGKKARPGVAIMFRVTEELHAKFKSAIEREPVLNFAPREDMAGVLRRLMHEYVVRVESMEAGAAAAVDIISRKRAKRGKRASR